MLLNTPLPFVETFVDELDNGLRAHEPGKGLSSNQRKWLGFCLMGILLTNSICWARFERASLGKYKQSALSWMFHHSQIAKEWVRLKYPGEKEYRYLVATDLSWRTIDLVQAYSLRWLVEVFIEDWKGYEGWAQLAKQQGKEGSSRGLSLSLLLDLCLLLHPEQLTRVENNLPAYTVGSLQRTIQMEALVVGIKQIVPTPNPAKQLALLTQSVKDFFVLRPSSKHMSGKDLGRLEPTPSLKHRAAA